MADDEKKEHGVMRKMTIKLSVALSVAVSGCNSALSLSGELFEKVGLQDSAKKTPKPDGLANSSSTSSGSASDQGSTPSSSLSPLQTSPTPPSIEKETKLFGKFAIDPYFEGSFSVAPGISKRDPFPFGNLAFIGGKVYVQFPSIPQEDTQQNWFPNLSGSILSGSAMLNVKNSHYDFAFPGKSRIMQSADASGSSIVDYMPIDGAAEYRKWVRFRVAHPADDDSAFSSFNEPDIVTGIDNERKIMTLQPGVASGVAEVPVGNLKIGWIPRCSGEGCPRNESEAEYISRLLAFGKQGFVFCSPIPKDGFFSLYYLPYTKAASGVWEYTRFLDLTAKAGQAGERYVPTAQTCGFNADDGKLYLWFGSVWSESDLLRIPEEYIVPQPS